MPLAAEYTWAESETTVQLQVQLRGRAKSTVDVFATECYVKISFPPYLLELDIDGCIDSAQHKARVEKGILVVKLKKKSDSFGIWGSLGQRVDRKCDPKVKARREQSIKEKLKWEEELKERVSLRKHHDERLSLRSQMGVDEAERRQIDDIKAEEKEKAEAEVYRTFADLAAKQNREEEPSTTTTEQQLLLPTPVSKQSKQASSGEKKQHALLSPPLASTAVAERSSGRPLGTIPEECSADEGGSPTPAASTAVVGAGGRKLGGPLRTIPEEISADEGGSPTPVASTAAAAKVANRPIWEETISNDGSVESGHRAEGAEGGGGDTSKAVLNPPVQDVAPDETKEDTIASDDDDGGGVAYVPAPRVPGGVIPIGFTTRLFPTPLRESKVADESAWIMKNRRHLHKNKTLVGRLPSESTQDKDAPQFDISESDPVWLKGKGDDLYRGGDFLGAINAYTAALDADPESAACLSNRAACHLRLGQTSACVADCGAALELFQALPETGPNQAKVLARRSLAYRELGHYKLSLEDCRAALGFNPGDAALRREAARAEPLALCEAAKKEAVARFASGDIAGACELYTAALAAVPAFPSCLSNRAACYLALGKPRDCVRDCTAVLDMLSAAPFRANATANPSRSDPEQDPVTAGRGVLMLPPGSVPPPGSEKRRRWVLTTMLRRARANVELGCLGSALEDYRAASSLAPDDKAVEGDIQELERLLDSEAERRPLTH